MQSPMQTSARWLCAVLGSALLLPTAAFSSALHPAGGQSRPDSREQQAAAQIIFDSANRERLSRGLSRLQWDANLAAGAQRHAEWMAREGFISHQFPSEPPLQTRLSSAGAQFSEAAENVAEGPDATVIHQEWMHSQHHRENLLNPRLNSIGVGVAERGGQMYAVEDFTDAVPSLTLSQQEQAARGRLRQLGLMITDRTEDARKDCATPHGYTGNPPPRFKARFTTTDPKQFPDELEKQIRTGEYRGAAVGACPSGDKSGFTVYRISVLLY